MQQIKIKTVGKFNGRSTKPTKAIDLGIKLKYSELTNAVKMLQLLNCDITMQAKIEDQKPFKIGIFNLWEVKVGHDGESVLKLNSTVDYVEEGTIDRLAGIDEFQIMFVAQIDDSEFGNNDDGEE